MQEIEKERRSVKPSKALFDESKLTPPQQEALAITKSQGKKLQLKRHELVTRMDSTAIDELMATVTEIRKQAGKPRRFE